MVLDIRPIKLGDIVLANNEYGVVTKTNGATSYDPWLEVEINVHGAKKNVNNVILITEHDYYNVLKKIITAHK